MLIGMGKNKRFTWNGKTYEVRVGNQRGNGCAGCDFRYDYIKECERPDFPGRCRSGGIRFIFVEVAKY